MAVTLNVAAVPSHCVTATGWAVITTLSSTLSKAPADVAPVHLPVTTTVYVASSAVDMFDILRFVVDDPVILPPSDRATPPFLHWYERGPVPVAET